MFRITGPTGYNPDVLCGTLTGQHSKFSMKNHPTNFSYSVIKDPVDFQIFQ